jgi:carbon-monoxide dehydrogenase small subunit
MERCLIELRVNGDTYEAAAKPNDTLLDVLRETLGFVGTKEGCGVGECGACTVVMNGRPVLSCLILALDAVGSEIITIEGLAQGEKLDPLQQSFVEHGAVQCGFCTPGMILTAKDLLSRNEHPTSEEIKQAVAGNFCRCTGYVKILEAIEAASKVQGSGRKAQG